MTLLENNETSHSLKFQFIFRNDKLTSYNNLYIILILFRTRFFLLIKRLVSFLSIFYTSSFPIKL